MGEVIELKIPRTTHEVLCAAILSINSAMCEECDAMDESEAYWEATVHGVAGLICTREDSAQCLEDFISELRLLVDKFHQAENNPQNKDDKHVE